MEEILKEIERLKDYLADTDYKAIQFAEGELAQEEYAFIRQQRNEARARVRELLLQVGTN